LPFQSRSPARSASAPFAGCQSSFSFLTISREPEGVFLQPEKTKAKNEKNVPVPFSFFLVGSSSRRRGWVGWLGWRFGLVWFGFGVEREKKGAKNGKKEKRKEKKKKKVTKKRKKKPK